MNADQIHDPTSIRILLADNHMVMRHGLRDLLERQEALTIVGEASNGQEAVELFRMYRPDILLIDNSTLITRLRHWIVPALCPRMAARDPLGTQPATLENAVLLDCFVRVGRAAGRVDTAWRQRRSQESLIEANQQQKRPVDHLFHWRTVSQIR